MSDDDWSLKGNGWIDYPDIDDTLDEWNSSNPNPMMKKTKKDITGYSKYQIDTLREKLIEDFRSRCWRGRHIGLGDIEQIINKRFGVD